MNELLVPWIYEATVGVGPGEVIKGADPKTRGVLAK